MKISFSTLSCPEWSWDDMIATAKDLGFDGIEVRGIENEMYVPKLKPFQEPNLEKTKARLSALDLEIPCLTSSCYLFDKERTDFYLQEGKDYIDLANKLGTPFVRVLGDQNPEPGTDIDYDFVRENLSMIARYAKGKNVKVLIETNGIFANPDTVLRLVEESDNGNVGVLWDVHHPFRFMNEPVEKTYDKLKKYIKFVHIKDSIIEEGKLKYKMFGYGDVPVKEALLLLKNDNFPGYVSLEWVKRWYIELEDPGVVIPDFLNFVKDVIE